MIIPLIQLGNVVGGFLLAAPAIERAGVAVEHVRRANEKLHPFRNLTGIIVFILGVLGLVGYFSFYQFWYFWASPLQALVALLIGLILASQTLRTLPFVSDLSKSLEPYSEYIGMGGIIVGLLGLV